MRFKRSKQQQRLQKIKGTSTQTSSLSAWERPVSHPLDIIPSPSMEFESVVQIKPKRVHRTSYESYQYHHERLKQEGFGMDPLMSKSEFEEYYELAKARGEKNIPRQFAMEERTYGKREAKSILKAIKGLDVEAHPELKELKELYKTASDIYGMKDPIYPESYTGQRWTARQKIWKDTIEAVKNQDKSVQRELRNALRNELEGIVY